MTTNLRRGHVLAGLSIITVVSGLIPSAHVITGLAFILLITLVITRRYDRRGMTKAVHREREAYRLQTLGNPDPPGQYNSRYIPQDVQIKVVQRDGGRCRQCLATDDLQFDHIIPWSRGGANTVDNIQLLCGTCNRAKSNRIAA